MRYNPDIHHRRSIRLRGYDYSQAGAYFLTIVTRDRECIFGDVADGEMRLSEYGCIASECWARLANHYANVGLDAFVVMPNHVHGIIVLKHGVGAGSPRPNHRGAVTAPLQRHTLGQIVAYFKYQVTKRINQVRSTPRMPVWQRNYYEHVIRNEDELDHIRGYILDNSMKWLEDEENPRGRGSRGDL